MYCFLSLPDWRPFIWPGPSEIKRLLAPIFHSFPWIRRFFTLRIPHFFLDSCTTDIRWLCVFDDCSYFCTKAGVCLFWLWFSPNISSNSVRSDSMNHSLLIPGHWEHPQGSHTTRDQVQCSELQSGFPFSHTPSANSSSYTYFTWPFWSVPIKTWFGWCLYVSSCSCPTAPDRVVPHAEGTRHCRCHGALCGHILARFLSLMPVLCRQNRLLVLQESEKGLFSWLTFRGEISLFLSVFT